MMVGRVVFAIGLSEAQVASLLTSTVVRARLDGAMGRDVRARRLPGRGDICQVTDTSEDFVVRFPRDSADLALPINLLYSFAASSQTIKYLVLLVRQ